MNKLLFLLTLIVGIWIGSRFAFTWHTQWSNGFISGLVVATIGMMINSLLPDREYK